MIKLFDQTDRSVIPKCKLVVLTDISIIQTGGQVIKEFIRTDHIKHFVHQKTDI